MVDAGIIVPYQGNCNGTGSGAGAGARHENHANGHTSEYTVRHGLPGTPRIQISWGTGNLLRLSFLPSTEERQEIGKVVQVQLGQGAGDGQAGAESRRIATDSFPFFVELQSQRRQQNNETLQGGSPNNW